jgi:hypothetical protein
MEKRYFLLFLISINLYGCFGWKPFQPNPPEYMMWKKSGNSQTDIKKILLECGFPTVYYINLTEIGMTNGEFIRGSRCMEKQGYLYLSDMHFCSGWHEKPPDCLPEATIPEPSVERRLNSRYCKSKSAHNAPECQP